MTKKTEIESATFLINIAVGDEVWWNDPDRGYASGYYRVKEIHVPEGEEILPDTILVLTRDSGSEAEVWASECQDSGPGGTKPVYFVGDIEDYCGRAESPELAAGVVAETYSTNSDEYVASSGMVAGKDAWIVRDAGSETVRLRLTLDVTYSLNGESADSLAELLRDLVQRAVGNGLLTGDTACEVEEYSMEARTYPQVSEEEIADYWAMQVEDGQVRPSYFGEMVARCGLTDPADFAAEMRERIDMASSEDE